MKTPPTLTASCGEKSRHDLREREISPQRPRAYAFTWSGEAELKVGDAVEVETAKGKSQGFVDSTSATPPKLRDGITLRPVLRVLEGKQNAEA